MLEELSGRDTYIYIYMYGFVKSYIGVGFI